MECLCTNAVEGDRSKHQPDTSISLESWHDDIHMLVGTGSKFYGHMAWPEVAGVRNPKMSTLYAAWLM